MDNMIRKPDNVLVAADTVTLVYEYVLPNWKEAFEFKNDLRGARRHAWIATNANVDQNKPHTVEEYVK